MILEKLNYKILTVRNPDNLKVMESGNTKTMYRNTASLHVILVKYSILNAQDRDNTNINRTTKLYIRSWRNAGCLHMILEK